MHGLIGPVDIDIINLRLVRDILYEHLPDGARVWAFGSRVEWTATDASDLDLAVDDHKLVDHKTISALNVAFDNSDLPFTVDIVDLKTTSDAFKKIINDYKVPFMTVYSKPANNQWSEVRLGEFAPFLYGVALPTEERNPSGGIPVVGSGGIVGYHDAGLTDGHTIVIGRKGDVGAVHYFSGPCWPIDTTFYVTGTDPLLVKFKYYVLQTLGLTQMSLSSTVPMLNRTAAHAKSLFVPSEKEQKNIAYVLNAFDAKIDHNREMNHTLEGMAQILFKSWFVDFEPVRTKTDGRWQQDKSLLHMPACMYDLFPDRLVHSELGDIPEGWTARAFGDCYNLTMGQSPPPLGVACDDKGGRLPLLQDGTDFGFRYPENSEYCAKPTVIAHADDTLVSVRVPVGVINMAWEECCAGSGIVVLGHKTGSRSFTYYSAWSLQHDLMQCGQTEAVSGAITGKQLKTLPIVEPPASLVMYFEACVSGWDKRIRLNTSESRLLMLQRDALMPKLISGMIRPSDIVGTASGRRY